MRQRGEAGSAGVVVLAVALALSLLGLLAVLLGAAAVARHVAGAAADLAALAAAESLAGGPEAACRQAAQVAVAGGVRLDDCTVDEYGVIVVVQGQPWRMRVFGHALELAGPRVAARAG